MMGAKPSTGTVEGAAITMPTQYREPAANSMRLPTRSSAGGTVAWVLRPRAATKIASKCLKICLGVPRKAHKMREICLANQLRSLEAAQLRS